MRDDLSYLFLTSYLQRLAVAAGATEAFGVEVDLLDGVYRERVWVHLRPGEALPDQKKNAVLITTNAVQQCLAKNATGVVRVSEPMVSGDSFFCSVLLLRPEDSLTSRPVGALAIIMPCKTLEIARERFKLSLKLMKS